MAEGILSFPFRLTPAGEVAVTPHGSDQEVDEAIAALVLTTTGERPMQPEYGVPDPVFAGLNAGDIQVGLDDYGPAGVLVTTVEATPVNNTQALADVQWTREDEDNL